MRQVGVLVAPLVLEDRRLCSSIKVQHIQTVKLVVNYEKRCDLQIETAVRTAVEHHVVFWSFCLSRSIYSEALRHPDVLQEQFFQDLILEVIDEVDPAVERACNHVPVVVIVNLFALFHSDNMRDRLLAVRKEHGFLVDQGLREPWL